MKTVLRTEPENIFKGLVPDRKVKDRGSLWTGTLMELTLLACSKLPHAFERGLHMRRVEMLYRKQLVGCKYHKWDVYTVDRYRFTNWVRQNRTKLCVTVSDMAQIKAELDQRADDFIRTEVTEYFELLNSVAKSNELESDDQVRVCDGDVLTSDDAGFYYGDN